MDSKMIDCTVTDRRGQSIVIAISKETNSVDPDQTAPESTLFVGKAS